MGVYYKSAIHYVMGETFNSGFDGILIGAGKNKMSIEYFFDELCQHEYNIQKILWKPNFKACYKDY